MLEIPPLDQIAFAAVAVGALFLLRYVLVIRRIREGLAHVTGFRSYDCFRAMKPGTFGEEYEPERRYAKRQLILGMLLLAVGLVMFAWLLATGAPIRLLA